ncbi:MAG TPA: hypothetical protein VKK79_23965 [Candidatus Lokiarchaeia archaeon]|nr:hypothetical protein [Candidatus Lokiarchaeia archaeon]
MPPISAQIFWPKSIISRAILPTSGSALMTATTLRFSAGAKGPYKKSGAASA